MTISERFRQLRAELLMLDDDQVRERVRAQLPRLDDRRAFDEAAAGAASHVELCAAGARAILRAGMLQAFREMQRERERTVSVSCAEPSRGILIARVKLVKRPR